MQQYECAVCKSIITRTSNQGIGQLDEDPARLRAAADYIERHQDSPRLAG